MICVDAVSEAEPARGSSIWDCLALRFPFRHRYSSYRYGFRIRLTFFQSIRWIAARMVCRRSWRVITFRNLARIQRPRCNQTSILVSLVRSSKNLYFRRYYHASVWLEMSTVTTRDVGKASGFSPSTVSIVLSNARLACYIPQNTQEKIKTRTSSAIVQTFWPHRYADSEVTRWALWCSTQPTLTAHWSCEGSRIGCSRRATSDFRRGA